MDEREILSLGIRASEEEASWTLFLRGWANRGLREVELAISDAHRWLQQAIGTVLTGLAWQRRPVHFMSDVLGHVPQRDKSIVAAAIRTVFAQQNQQAACQQLLEVVRPVEPRCPKTAEVVDRG